jgi:predicted amidohydrolase YtcJ
MPIDLVVTGARIHTLDAARPAASALAIANGRIERVGSDAEVLAIAGEGTRRLDAGGATIVPGFHDCHLHLLWMGVQRTTQADLVGVAGLEDLLARLAEQSRRCDGWIRGHGFDQEKLAGRRFPTRAELDRVSRDRPVLISRICGHAAVANSAAIALLDEPARSRGLDGLFTEDAAAALYAIVPAPDDATLDRALDAAMAVALRSGITSVQTLLDTPEQMRVYTRMRRTRGRLPIRVTGIFPERCAESLHTHGIATGFGDDWLRVGGAKFFSDGSLGARTALLARPYADDPSAIGVRMYDPRQLQQRCHDVQRMGFQLVIHAIGDQALRETLDAIEFALAGESNLHHRHRVEHASVCPPDLLERMATRQVVATLQPQFVTSDTWTGERVGTERTPWCYPFASLRAAGVPIGLSSDAPVETLDAMQCLSSAVNRHAWSPDQVLSVADVIDAYCVGSAYCGHREHVVGTLAAGHRGDFVMLSDDPFAIDRKRLASIRATRVFVDGVEASLHDHG